VAENMLKVRNVADQRELASAAEHAIPDGRRWGKVSASSAGRELQGLERRSCRVA
jgi:hypothetical protein